VSTSETLPIEEVVNKQQASFTSLDFQVLNTPKEAFIQSAEKRCKCSVLFLSFKILKSS
jgi:hypothetical protein